MWRTLDDITVMTDAAVITWVSGAVTAVLGYVEHELVGVSVRDLMHPDDRSGFDGVRSMLHSAGHGHLRSRIRRRDGSWCWIDARLTVLPADRSEPASSRVLAFWRDASLDIDETGGAHSFTGWGDDVEIRVGPDGSITWTLGGRPADPGPDDATDHATGTDPVAARPPTDTVPSHGHALLGAHAADVLLHVQHDRIVSVSPSMTPALGWHAAELAGLPVAELVHRADAHERAEAAAAGATWRARHRVRSRDGSWHWVETHASLVRAADGAALGTVESWRVIDDQVAIERELTRRATHDGLTGLLNRSAVLDRLTHLLDARQGPDAVVALVYIDVDDFKAVNDRYGHATGDEILARLGRTIRSVVRQDDLVGRLGGDEILVVLRAIGDLGVAANVAIKVLAAARSVGRTPQGAAVPTLSVGVTLARPPESVAAALARADRAMYQAKRAGGDHVVTRAERT